jgi:acetate kinase
VFALLTDPEKGIVKGVHEIAAIGHRVVHGGEKFVQPILITDDVVAGIEKVSQLAPLHNPPNLDGIRACRRLMPGVPQVAVFDTAFHATIPDYAYMYALPYDYYTAFGVRRYGFHGTSHQYVAGIALGMLAEQGIARETSRIVTCHLGNGCSMAAIQGGRVVDTSMGLTPAEGLVMGTRSGDLDPAILVYLARRLDADVSDIDRIINKESGLLGLSGLSSDMRDIEEEAAKGNARAELALEVVCYRIRKYVGAYAAAMGGLDAIVFTAGIGENSPVIRERVCRDLGFLGVDLDDGKNATERGRAVDLATESSRVRVLLVPTNEERMIARETMRIIAGSAALSQPVETR